LSSASIFSSFFESYFVPREVDYTTLPVACQLITNYPARLAYLRDHFLAPGFEFVASV